MAERVTATPAALALIAKLQAEHGLIVFYQSGGCCEGSAPMCLGKGELAVSPSDVLLGEVGGAPFYMGQSHFDYMEHTHMTLDVAPGQGGMFSLEGPHDVRFVTRSRLYSEEEFASLPPVVSGVTS
jgi:uncharacterized protein